MIKKYRIIKWITVFLLIINVSAFITILFLNYKSDKSSVSDDSKNNFSSDLFLKKELSLSDEQYKKISSLDNKTFRMYQTLLDMECEANFEIIDELTRENPSESRLDSIASHMGRVHAGLKRQTIKHFINIKSICNQDQVLLLDQILIDMMQVGDLCRYCNKKDCDRRDELEKK
ncbi:MAG: hypothetical protein IMY72_06500 [Bacteroidetes bacterium]|nr:hypothetical protein [Bacteroidota bacterium]